MPDVILRFILISSAIFYFTSFVLLIINNKLENRKLVVLSDVFYFIAVAVNGALIVYNYVANLMQTNANYMPFVSIYQLLVFIAFIMFPVRLLFEKILNRKEIGYFFVLGAAFIITAVCFLSIDAVWEFRPALRSPFFIPHIFCYVIAYALSLISFFIVIEGYVRKKDNSELASLCARLLFPFMTCGLFMGAIWADQIWGDFWSWDLKESWSLVTWFTYMISLHLYKRAKTRKVANVFIIFGFVFVIMTFLFSRIFPNISSVHSYN